MKSRLIVLLAVTSLLCGLVSCNNATDVTANRNVSGTVTTNVSSLKITNSNTDLGTVKAGSANDLAVVFENNSTTDSVKVTTLAFNKGNQHFSLLHSPSLPLIVAPKGSPNSSLSLNVRFDAPNAKGTYTDELVLNGDLTAPIRFNARIQMSPPDTIDINQDCSANVMSLDFDTLSTSNPMRIMTFVLTNHDTDSYMRIPNPTWSSNSLTPFGVYNTNTPLILAPGGSVSISVSGSYTVGGIVLRAGHYSRVLSFGNIVNVTCNAIVYTEQTNEIITTDATMTMKVGQTNHFACHIVNRSAQPCTLYSVPTPSNAGFDCVFSIVNTTLPVTIAPNAAVEIIGDLTAKAPGVYTAVGQFGITAGSGVVLDDVCAFSITITP